jgi:glyceraldehyde 3-phosphate dehydrogenase
MLATLLKYDSTHRRFPGTVEHDAEHLIVNGKAIKATSIRNPAECPWGDLGVDVVVESTGVFADRKKDGKPGYDSHLDAGAKRVVLSAPAKDDKLTPDLKCISNASCTTNCLAPVAQVIHQAFGIHNGLMTTIHAYTNDQNVQDLPHRDPYRARAAAMNIIPTTTGAASAVGLVIPELKGKLTGISMRVPVVTGSVVDLTVNLEKTTTAADVNAAIKQAAEGRLKGILDYTEDPIVSSDIIGDPHSSIFVGPWTQMMGDRLLKVVSWYDNEWGYSCRTVDLLAKIAKL